MAEQQQSACGKCLTISHYTEHGVTPDFNTSCCDLLHAVAAGTAAEQQAASSRLQQLQQAGRRCCYCCLVRPCGAALDVYSGHRCSYCSKGRRCSSSSCCSKPGEGHAALLAWGGSNWWPLQLDSTPCTHGQHVAQSSNVITLRASSSLRMQRKKLLQLLCGVVRCAHVAFEWRWMTVCYESLGHGASAVCNARSSWKMV